ncbi:MAG: hypothetical protein ACRDYC_06465 [Acidimicrobiales bacterium]
MGANLLSLSVPRAAVLVEGAADAILLPTLLRQACGLENLPYRFAPGIAELPAAAVPDLSSHGGQVVVLLDGDEGGRDKRAELERGGFPGDRILDLSLVDADVTLEDLVTKAVFAEAVNQEIAAWAIGGCRIEAAPLPDLGRWRWLEAEGERQAVTLRRLSKPAVAQRVVDLNRTNRARSLMEPPVAERLRAMHQQLSERLLPGAMGTASS